MKKNNLNIDLSVFKKKLQKERALLLSQVQKVAQKNPSNPADWEAKSEDMDIERADRNEVADKFESFEGDAAILKELEPQLNDVKLALGKIEDGTYGVCEVCGEAIETDRLEANPAARTCKKDINARLV